MAVEIVMPRFGWTMEEGLLAEWSKQDGDAVKVGDVLFTVESDKALNEVESFENGILRIPPGAPAAGAMVRVGALLAYIVQPGERAPFEDRPSSATPASTAGTPEVAALPNAAPRAPPPPHPQIAPPPTTPGGGGRGHLTGERMLAGAHNAAPVTLTTEVDATELVRLRGQLKTDAQASTQPIPSYTDLMAKVAAHALLDHPALNARLEGEAIIQSSAVHIGLAVDTERGLLVAVGRG